jgi:mono/diheme cytochrome c family protein
VSYVGGFFTLSGLALVLLAIVFETSQKHPSPYLGIFTYVLFPSIIAFGVVVFLAGMYREAKRRRSSDSDEALRLPSLDLNDPRQRKRFLYAVGITFVLFNVFVYSGYNGFLLTESVSFCGKTCHTPMNPELTAYNDSPHAGVRCVECHVGNGAGSYMASKLNGAKQLYGVLFNAYDRPILTPIKGLRPARETCQECHWPKKYFGSQLYQRAHFRYDEKSKPEQITMMIKTGGGGESGAGIHWHMIIDNEVTYAAQDTQLQDIPWVRMKHKDGSTIEYFRTERKVDAAGLEKLPKRTMDCMDCHNRPAHTFEPPDIAVDRMLLTGVIPRTLPFVKSLSVDTLAKEYPSNAAAHEGMRKDVLEFYTKKYPEILGPRAADIDKMVAGLNAIFDRNVFPEMKVSWRTYPSNLGHRNSAGCFRCHDNKHVSPDGKVLASECTICHTEPKRGAQSGMGEPMSTFEKDWHPWEITEKHLAIKEHASITCYECHVGGRRPKTECNECHSR